MTPFSGVRISWLMTARNSDRARAAASAASRASASTRAARFLFGDVGERAHCQAGIEHLGADLQHRAVAPRAAIDAAALLDAAGLDQSAHAFGVLALEFAGFQLPLPAAASNAMPGLARCGGRPSNSAARAFSTGTRRSCIDHQQALADIVHRGPQHRLRPHGVAPVAGPAPP